MQDTRARGHSFFNWRRTKFHAPRRREHKKHLLQGTPREVGRASRKVHAHVSKGENSNLQGQGERKGGGGKRNIHTLTSATEQHSAPSTQNAKTIAGQHTQHANPKGVEGRKKGDNALYGNGATPGNAGW